MTTSKKAFLYRKSNEDVLKEFPEEIRGKILLWILEYGFTGKIPGDCPDNVKMALKFAFLSIDIEKRRYENTTKINSIIALLENFPAEMIYSDDTPNGKRIIKKADLDVAIKRLKRLAYKVKRSSVDNISQEIFDCMGAKIKEVLFSVKKAKKESKIDYSVMALSGEELKLYVKLVQKINNYEGNNQRPLTAFGGQNG